MSELGAPFNWCDRICERCPLSGECPIPEHDRRVRGVPIVAVVRKIAAERAESVRVVIARDGAYARSLTSPSPWPSPPPRAPDTARLLEASMRYACSLRELAARDREVMRLSVLLHGKVARIADDEEELWELDTVPNLLLIERTLDELREACGRVPAPIAAHEEILRAWLAPLFARISPEVRASVGVLARAGRAPSPFSQTGPAGGAWPVRRAAERS